MKTHKKRENSNISRILRPWKIIHHCGRAKVDLFSASLRRLRFEANIKKRGMTAGEASKRIDFEFEEFQKYILPGANYADCLVGVSLNYEYKLI